MSDPIPPCGQCGQPHVTVQPAGHQACRGHKSAARGGAACRLHPMVGQAVCGSHGGKNPTAKAAGARRVAEAKAVRLAARWGVPVEVDGPEAILGQIHVWAGIERFYRERAEQLSDDEKIWGRTRHKDGGDDYGTTFEAKPHMWIVLHERASLNLVRCAAEAIRAGIDERRVRLAEQQGAQVADTLKGIADAVLRALVAAGLGEELAAVFTSTLEVEAPRHLRLLTA
jgi:hypothetical protein